MQGYPVRSLFRSTPVDWMKKVCLLSLMKMADWPQTSKKLPGAQQTNHNLIYEGFTDPTITGSLGKCIQPQRSETECVYHLFFGNVIRLIRYWSNQYTDLDAMPKEFKTVDEADDEHQTNIRW